MFPLVVESGQGHQLDSVPVSGKCKGNGIPLISPAHELGGSRNDFIHIRRAGVTDFCAPDNDALTGLSVDAHAVRIGPNDMEEHIRVRLLVGPLVL